MYRVLIVDDEIFVRMGLKASIDWEKYDFELIGEASNGVQALDIISKNTPDIVLTDIKMPVMDGVRLIKEITHQYPLIKCIVLSNYNDFELVKEAMKSGAIDYFCKVTIDIEKIINVLKRVCEKIKDERHEMKEITALKKVLGENRSVLVKKFLEDLENSDVNAFTAEHIQKKLHQLGLKISSEKGIVLVVKVLEYRALLETRFEMDCNHFSSTVICLLEEIIRHEFTGEVFEYKPGIFVVVVADEEDNMHYKQQWLTEKIQTLLNEYLSIRLCIIYDIRFSNFNALKKVLMQLSDIALLGFYDDKGALWSYRFSRFSEENIDSSAMYRKMKSNLTVSIKFCDCENIFRTIEEFLEDMKSKNIAPPVVKNMIISIFSFMNTQLLEKHSGKIDAYNMDFILKLESLSNFAELKDCCRSFLEAYTTTLQELNSHRIRRDMLKAIAYIERHYTDKITLADVARDVSMNKSYFSRLFKKVTGENFHNYLLSVRMQKASEYLLNTDRKITDIAASTGYKDLFYFNRVFKNYFRVSPSVYRKTNQ